MDCKYQACVSWSLKEYIRKIYQPPALEMMGRNSTSWMMERNIRLGTIKTFAKSSAQFLPLQLVAGHGYPNINSNFRSLMSVPYPNGPAFSLLLLLLYTVNGNSYYYYPHCHQHCQQCTCISTDIVMDFATYCCIDEFHIITCIDILYTTSMIINT